MEKVVDKAALMADMLATEEQSEPVQLTRQQTFGMLVKRHGALVAEYQETKLTARLSELSGDKEVQMRALGAAGRIFQRIKALRVVADEQGLGEEYGKVMDQFKKNQEAAGQKVVGDAAEPAVVEKPKRGRPRKRAKGA